MTVLQRQTAGDVSSQRGRKYLVAALMAVVGLGAAFGLSQVMGSSSQTVSGDNQARIEAGAAYGAALEQAAELQRRTEAGAAYAAALEAARQANVWTLEDEMAAIQQSRHDLNTVRGSVGTAAMAQNADKLGWELDQIQGVGTTPSDAETAVKNRFGAFTVE